MCLMYPTLLFLFIQHLWKYVLPYLIVFIYTALMEVCVRETLCVLFFKVTGVVRRGYYLYKVDTRSTSKWLLFFSYIVLTCCTALSMCHVCHNNSESERKRNMFTEVSTYAYP